MVAWSLQQGMSQHAGPAFMSWQQGMSQQGAAANAGDANNNPANAMDASNREYI